MQATRSRRGRHHTQRRILVAIAAVGGVILAAAPTGVTVVDALWCAGFAATLTYCAGWTPRTVMLPVAAAVLAVADSRISLGLAGAGLLVAVVNAGRIRFSTRYGMTSGALVAGSLLTGSGPEDHRLAAATTTLLSLVVVVSALTKMSRRRRRIAFRIGLGLGGFVFVCAVAGVASGVAARDHVDVGTNAFQLARDTGENGDIQGALASFSKAERAFRKASSPLTSYGQLGRLVPGLSQQLAVATIAVDAAGDAAEAGRRAGGSIDLDSIAVNDGGVDLAALARLEPPLRQLAQSVGTSIARLQGVDRRLLATPVSDALDDALADARQAGLTADRFHRAVLAAPVLLGSDAPRRYLVLFTSPDETRGRLGFPGAYAVLRLDGGRMSFETTGDMAGLDAEQTIDPARIAVPDRAQAYVPYKATTIWRSVTAPPDAPASADVARQFAAQGPLGHVDGVVFADPQALAALVGLVGDIPLPRVGTLTEGNAVDYLVRRQYLEFPDPGQAADRKDLLGEVAAVVGERLEGLSLPKVSDLTARFGPIIAQGHLMLAVDPVLSPTAAALFAEVGADGSFPRAADGYADIVYVAQSNTASNKLDLFLRRALSYKVDVAEDGSLDATLTVALTNTAPSSGLLPYVSGSPPKGLPVGTNLTTTLLYSRHQLTEMTVDGVPLLPAVSFDGGLFVYQVQTDLAPGQTKTVVATLRGRSLEDVEHIVVYPGGLVIPDMVSLDVRDARTKGAFTETTAVAGPLCRTTDEARVPCQ